MNAETKAKFDARMQELPNSVRGAIQKTQLSENLQAITISHHLHIDQAEVLEELVMGTVLGYQSFQTLAPSIESGVKVSAEQASAIAKDISTMIFRAVRENLERELGHPDAKIENLTDIEKSRMQLLQSIGQK